MLLHIPGDAGHSGRDRMDDHQRRPVGAVGEVLAQLTERIVRVARFAEIEPADSEQPWHDEQQEERQANRPAQAAQSRCDEQVCGGHAGNDVTRFGHRAGPTQQIEDGRFEQRRCEPGPRQHPTRREPGSAAPSNQCDHGSHHGQRQQIPLAEPPARRHIAPDEPESRFQGCL